MPKRLSKRLRTIADMVPAGAYLADVGSDHAWLPIFLVESGKISWAMAIDNKMGPFLRMKENVSRSPMANHILCSHSDGISQLGDSVDTVALCGIGGLLACEILEAHPEKLRGVSTIIVDPHRDLIAVRKRVSELGFRIEDERMVFEDRTYYTIIRFVRGAPAQPYTNNELAFGPILMKQVDNPTVTEWLLAQRYKLNKLLNTESLSKQKRDVYSAMYRAVMGQLSLRQVPNADN